MPVVSPIALIVLFVVGTQIKYLIYTHTILTALEPSK